MQTYTLQSIQSMLRLSRKVIDSLMANGFVSPRKGDSEELLFTFQDMVVLRAAHDLQQQNIPASKIVKALERLRATLPPDLPLTAVRISADGKEVAVRDGTSKWHAESGQMLIDFELQPGAGSAVSLLERRRKPAMTDQAEAEYAQDAFNDALVLEENVLQEQAAAAYRKAIELAPDWCDPYLNLGAMLCENHRCEEALDVYRQGLEHCPREPLLHFNMGVALEDMGRSQEALAAYGRALELDDSLADAHYNAARLHECAGNKMGVIRHLSAYKRLQG